VSRGALPGWFKALSALLEAAREDLPEAEFRGLEIALERELGIDRETRPRGRPLVTLPADVVAEVLRMRANGRSSYVAISRALGISKRQVEKIVRAEGPSRK